MNVLENPDILVGNKLSLQNATLYVDMDGVIVNFLGGVEKEVGCKLDPTVHGVVDIYWSYLNGIPLFWESLPWMDDAHELWDALKKYSPHVLSACNPDTLPQCPIGKHTWCDRELRIPRSRVHIVDRKEKRDYAVTDGQPNILIDDYTKNIVEWEEAGGVGIFHNNTAITLSKLAKFGFK